MTQAKSKIKYDYDTLGNKSQKRRDEVNDIIQNAIDNLQELNNELDNENPNEELIYNLDMALRYLDDAKDHIE